MLRLLIFLTLLSISLPAIARSAPTGTSEASLFLPSSWTGGADCIACSPDGTTIATASLEGVLLWESGTGRYLQSLSRADGPLLAYSPDGRMLAVSYDTPTAKVQLLDAQTGVVQWNIDAFEPPQEATTSSAGRYQPPLILTCLVFSPDGKTLATVANGSARLWDVQTGRQKNWKPVSDEPINSLTFSPDGKTFVLGEGNISLAQLEGRWASSSNASLLNRLNRTVLDGGVPDGALAPAPWEDLSMQNACPIAKRSAVTLYDARSGKLLHDIVTVDGIIDGLHFLPDGRSLAYIRVELRTHIGGQNSALEVRDVRSGEVRWIEEHCTGFAISPNGRTIAALGTEYCTRLLNGRTGRTEKRFALCTSNGGATFSPDGATLITGGRHNSLSALPGLRLWNLRTGRLCANLREPLRYSQAQAALSSDGKHLMIENDEGRIDTWSLKTGALHSVQIPGMFVSRALFSSDGKRVLELADRLSDPVFNYGFMQSLRLRDCRTGRILKYLYPEQDDLWLNMAWSPDDTLIATTKADNKTRTDDLWIWDAHKARRLFSLTPPKPSVDALFFTRDANRLVCVSQTPQKDDTSTAEIDIWDLRTRQLLSSLSLINTSKVKESLLGLTPEDHLMIARYEQTERQEGTPDKLDTTPNTHISIQLRDLSTTNIIREWSIQPQIVKFSINYEHSTTCTLSADRKTLLVDTDTTPAESPVFPNLMARLAQRKIFTALYESETGRLRSVLPNSFYAEKLFFPDAKRAISTSSFGFDIWEVTTGHPILHFNHLPPIGSWIAYTPTSDYTGSPDVQHYLYWRHNDLPEVSDSLADLHYRPDLLRTLSAPR